MSSLVDQLRATLLKSSAQEVQRNSDLGSPGTRDQIPFQSDSNGGHLMSDRENFLKDLVYRLNSELAAYHVKYPHELMESDTANSPNSSAVENWDHITLQPLLRAYDDRMAEMKLKMENKESEFETMKAELKVLKLENNRLNEQIALGEDFYQSGVGYSDRDAANDRIRMLTEENDILLTRQRALNKECGETREALESAQLIINQLSSELNVTREALQADRENSAVANISKETFDKAMNKKVQEAQMYQIENERLVSNMESMRKDYLEMEGQLHEAKKRVTDLTLAYKSGVSDIQRFADKEGCLMQDLRELQSKADDYESLYITTSSELEMSKMEKDELLASLQSLERQLGDYEERHLDHISKLEKSVEEMKQARLETETLLLKETQLQKDVQRLEDRLRKQREKTNEKIKIELDTIKSTFNEERRQMLNELATLQFEKAELQVSLDRAIREKRCAEEEAEKMKTLVPNEFERLNGTLEEYQQRLRRFELERNEATNRLQSLQIKMSREENQFQAERLHFTQENDRLIQRLKSAEREADESKDDRLQLFNQLQETVHKLKEEKEARETESKTFSQSIQKQEKTFEFERKEFERKLTQSEAVIERLNKEVQDLLMQQQKLASQWKEEVKNMTRKYVAMIEDLESKNKKSDAKCSELTKQRIEMSVLKDELSRQLEDMKKTHAKMHILMKNTEGRANNLSQQVRMLLSREQELVGDLKSLQRTVDQLQLENKRILRKQVSNEKRTAAGLPELRQTIIKTNEPVERLKHKIVEMESFMLSSSLNEFSSVEPSEMDMLTKENVENI